MSTALAILAGLAGGPIGARLGYKFTDWREKRAVRP